MPIISRHLEQNLKNAYWARFFPQQAGGYTVDVPDMPGCATSGADLEEAYQRLIAEAIPLWLEDQPWPEARKADEVMKLPYDNRQPPSVLVRISIGEVGGNHLSALSVKAPAYACNRSRLN